MVDGLTLKTEKPWRFEILIALAPRYAGKIIFIRKRHRASLQYHERKDETIYIREGKVVMEIEGSEGRLTSTKVQPGYSVRIPPLTKDRLQAVEVATCFEVSTSALGDVIRLADDYGRV